jgi:starch synthase
MNGSLNVLFLAAEAEPFVKVGGLGDVAGSLPRYLRQLSDQSSGGSIDVRVVLPFHSVLKAGRHGLRPVLSFPLEREQGDVRVQVFSANVDGLPFYLLDGSPIAAGGSVYSSDPVLDGEKYTFFSLAALELARRLDWRPDIIHANDWHAALACYALLVRRRMGEYQGVASVLTLHNLPFMGPDVAATLHLYRLAIAQTGLPEWASPRPLPLGLWAADAIVAVSPSYAREIQTRDFGCGLENYLRARRDSLNGILNGIDYDSYNPALDPALASNFGIPTLERRPQNKSALQLRLKLPREPQVPLLGVVSRLDPQKGIDLLRPALRKLRDLNWQLVALGTGAPALEKSIRALQAEFPDRVRAEIKYDAGLARQIYAGADIFLMPSRYEPCGLSQMIALRYGCVPIVSAVGGLQDTIFDGETGFVIKPPTATRLATAIKQAISIRADAVRWTAMQKAGMSQDFSWRTSAQRYLELYRRLVAQAMPG